MERQKVSSSNINSIGYDYLKMILEIEFKNGTIYHYSSVPKSIVEKLMKADSVGKYFAQNIKNSFNYNQI